MSKEKIRAKSSKVIKGLSVCSKCQKKRLECKKFTFTDGTTGIFCKDCSGSSRFFKDYDAFFTSKDNGKAKFDRSLIYTSFESKKAKH